MTNTYKYAVLWKTKESLLAAVTGRSGFLYDLISPSYHCWEILAHCLLQYSLSDWDFTGICLCTALLRSLHCISVRLRSRLGHCNTLILWCYNRKTISGFVEYSESPTTPDNQMFKSVSVTFLLWLEAYINYKSDEKEMCQLHTKTQPSFRHKSFYFLFCCRKSA